MLKLQAWASCPWGNMSNLNLHSDERQGSRPSVAVVLRDTERRTKSPPGRDTSRRLRGGCRPVRLAIAGLGCIVESLRFCGCVAAEPVTLRRALGKLHYLARLSYVYYNPVRHGVVDWAEKYRWCFANGFAQNAKPL